jgi:DNA-directed RNA polymerase specialized sigma24 family protein
MPDDLQEKLDVLIRLQAAALIAPIESSKERILFLHKAGLRPLLIAEIVGTTTNHVNVTLSQARKKPRNKTREK